MAVFVPLIPLAIRVALLGTAAWAGTRIVQSDGDVSKAAKKMRKDVSFLGDSSVRKIKDAAEILRTKGGEYASFASLLLTLAETIAGGGLAGSRQILDKIQLVLNAYAAFDAKKKNVVSEAIDDNIESLMNEVAAEVMRDKGFELINESKVGALTLTQYLSRYYLGLYYIGRAGSRLGSEEIDSRAIHLTHIHKQAGEEQYQGLMKWFANSGEGQPTPLLPLLAACDLITTLNVDPRYIASALGQSETDLSFDGILEDLLARFPK